MKIIGITGGIGTGKTELAGIFKKFGAHVIDADETVHRLYSTDRKMISKIAEEFGGDVIKNGEVDRGKLSAIVFKDAGRLKALNRIVHRKAAGEIRKEAAAYKNCRLVVLDVPIPVKRGFLDLCDIVITVKCSDMEKRIKRLVIRNGITEAEALRRIGSQLPQSAYDGVADHIIENDGDIAGLEEKAGKLIAELGI